MTTPDSSSPDPMFGHPRAVKILARRPLTLARAAQIIVSVSVSVTIIAGVLIHFTDRKSFPNFGDGLWWAVQTVTTVGYGDVVPKSVLGRLVAAVVMLGGVGFLTVITAVITSAFIESARRRIQGTTTDTVSTKLDQISARLEVIEKSLADIPPQARDHPQ